MSGELGDLALEAQLRCLNEFLKWPIKKEESFEINTCYILDQYLRLGMPEAEQIVITFNQLAAVLDWATKIYSLKVDYIYEIAYNIYEFFQEHYEQAQHPSSEAEPTTSRNEDLRQKRKKLDQIPCASNFRSVRLKWCRQKPTRRHILRLVDNLVTHQFNMDPPRSTERGLQDNDQPSEIKLIQYYSYRRLLIDFLSIDMEENYKSVKSLIKLRPVSQEDIEVAALLNTENEVPHPSDLLTHPSDLLPHSADILPHPSDLLPHPSDSLLVPCSPTADLSDAHDEPPLTETPKAVVQPPQHMHRRKRKLFDDDDLEKNHIDEVLCDFGQSLKLQKEYLSQLSERTEFSLPEEYGADRLAEKRCRMILQLRRDLDFTAEADQGVQGLDESLNISDIECGFRGWCSTDVEEAQSVLDMINTSIRSIDTALETTCVESVDEGFFDRSSVEESYHSPVASRASITFTPAAHTHTGNGLDKWVSEVAARSLAAEKTSGVDVKMLGDRVRSALPQTGAVPFPRLLAATAKRPPDVSHLFLTTLDLANKGEVRIVKGAPLVLEDFAVERAAPARLPQPLSAAT